MKDVDIEKIVVSGKISSGKKTNKYFISYLCDNKIKPLFIMLPKTNASAKSYDGQTKCIYFLIENNYLLKKYNTIWDKASADIKKESDSEPVYKKTLKTKINFLVMKVKIFLIKKFLRWTLLLFV